MKTTCDDERRKGGNIEGYEEEIKYAWKRGIGDEIGVVGGWEGSFLEERRQWWGMVSMIREELHVEALIACDSVFEGFNSEYLSCYEFNESFSVRFEV